MRRALPALTLAILLSGCAGAVAPSTPTSSSAPSSAAAAAASTRSASAAHEAPSSGAAPATVTLTPPGAVPALDAVAFPDAVHGWAAGGGTILATGDGGRTWAAQYTTKAVQITALDFVDPRHGWAVGLHSLLRTVDGSTWQAVGEPAQPLTAIDFVSATDGWGIAGSTMFHSTDAGQTWKAVTLPAAAGAVCFGTPADGWMASGTGVYRTTDGGAAWRKIHTLPDPAPNGARWQLGCAGGGTVWGLAVFGAGMMQQSYVVVHTTDGGATWSTPFAHGIGGLGPGMPAGTPAIDSYVGPFAVASSGNSALFAGQCPACGMARASVTVTAEGGSGAYHTFPGLHVDPAAVAFPDGVHGWIVASQGGVGRILATADGGKTWAAQYPAGPSPTLAIDVLSANLAYGVGALGDPAAVLRSDDGGATWNRVGTLPGSGAPEPYLSSAERLSFWDAKSGYAITADGQLARTGDGGAVWTPVRVASAAWTSIAFVGDGRYGCLLKPDGNPRALGTSDGGSTWTALPAPVGGALACALGLQGDSATAALVAHLPPPPNTTTLLAVAAPAHAWARHNGTLYTTANGGRTWTDLPLRDRSGALLAVQSASFVNGAALLLTADGSVLGSSDGRARWTLLAG